MGKQVAPGRNGSERRAEGLRKRNNSQKGGEGVGVVVGTPGTEEINKGSATTEVEGNAAGNQPPQTFHCEVKPSALGGGVGGPTGRGSGEGGGKAEDRGKGPGSSRPASQLKTATLPRSALCHCPALFPGPPTSSTSLDPPLPPPLAA